MLESPTTTHLSAAFLIREFLETTSSQLTYHGLFTLAASIKPGTLVALFRNSHLSVLYKPSTPSTPKDTGVETMASNPPNTDLNAAASSSLYTLTTDYSFLREPTVVWERLDDVDGGASTFVDSDFRPSVPLGGDFAGATAESALADEFADMGIVDHAEYVLQSQTHVPNEITDIQYQSRVGTTTPSGGGCDCTPSIC
jgi:ubiquitin carboxyl-terminal hydrolase MINDY-1/2